MRGNPWGYGQRLAASSSGGTDRLPLLPQDSAAEAKNAQKSARATGLEPATSGVTGGRSNQLSYARRGSEHRRPTHGPTERADSSHWSFCFSSALSTLEPSAAGASAEPGQRLNWNFRIGPTWELPSAAVGRPSAKLICALAMFPSASAPWPVVEKSSNQPRKSLV